MTNEEMREASGNISSPDPMVSFLYLLMRDHITPGLVEEIVMKGEKTHQHAHNTFTNGWLAQYAINLAGRLKG